MNIKETIINILAQTMGADISSIRADTVLQEIPEFDSLQFVMLISELEETYGIEIPLDKALDAKTVNDLVIAANQKQ